MYLSERITFGTTVISAVFTFIDFNATLILILRKLNMNEKFFLEFHLHGFDKKFKFIFLAKAMKAVTIW